ncbi:MAG: ABC transporter ATP-binding protein/permease [Bacteroidales bacterium]|nr:ABC transporter ATP-binding protein [Anaerotignum sp.]MCI5679526.1 ABC transporter ATP-binding protein/permease [Bacteroidales bacterium]MDY3927015.1 ABC transporter ATP-binding protein [Anaerotignum sp.]
MKKIWEYMKPYQKLAILAPLLMLLEVSAELAMPKIMTYMINQGVGMGNTALIAKTGVAMLIISVIGIFGGIGCLICASIVSQRTGTDLRRSAFQKIQEFSFHNIDTFSTPSLITRLTNDITQIQLVIMMCLRMLVRSPLLCIGSIVMAFSINAKIASLFIFVVLLLAGAVFLILKAALPKFKMVQEKLDKVNTVMRECLAGIRVVKAFVRNEYEMEKFTNVNEDYKNTTISAFKLMLLMMPIMMILVNGTIIAILWFGGLQAYAGSMAVEEIMACITYLMQMMMATMMLAMSFMFISRAKVSTDRLTEVLDTVVDIADPAEPKLPSIAAGRVEYKNVSYRYKMGSGDPVLESISFTAEPGQTIGILGETGSGKSTLVNLLPRLYDVTEGQILVDGVDVRNYAIKDLRKRVAVVLQETILFSGTIKDNIKWGKPDATDEEIIAAAKAAQAHDFIMELPEKYDTELGQRGVNVSGGQKQRISIARALIQNPEIIIFDDSTSAVDSLTEKNIRQAMKESHNGCTKFIIAQRISSVRDADKILVLSGGRIVAEGNHNYLMETSKDYQEILASQMKKGVMADE